MSKARAKVNGKANGKANGKVNGAGEHTAPDLSAAIAELQSRLNDTELEAEFEKYRLNAELELLGEYKKLGRLLEEINAVPILQEHCTKPWQWRVSELDWLMREIHSLDDGDD